jgi:hypothetical protein
VVDPKGKGASVQLTASQRKELGRIANELAALARSGPALPGTIAERLTRCGRENCACHADPPRRHGPYFHWTRKVANKTVGRWLSVEQAQDYRHWVDAHEIRGADPRFER